MKTGDEISQSAIYSFIKACEEDSNINLVNLVLLQGDGVLAQFCKLLFPQPNWIKAFLAQEFPHDPGTYYRYSTHATHMLSAIIQKTSGQSLEEFLNTYMFFPMNITEAEWEFSPEGLTAGGMGLSLYPSSLIKFASLLLNKGFVKRDNKRIIEKRI